MARLVPLAAFRRVAVRRVAVGLVSPAASSLDPAAAPDAASERESALVAAEDRRLLEIRSVTAVAGLRGAMYHMPYRLSTGSGYTLVLTGRSAPYTVADLLRLAPQTFLRQRDGSYLLLENIYLNSGAKLVLANPGGLTLRLVSNGQGFVSIVSFGGDLSLSGTAQAPMRLTSWDPRTQQPDTDPTDGRAYLRAIGGQFAMTYVAVVDLGFWSGRTGGVGLTGTDRPNTGSTSSAATHLTKAQRHEAKRQRLAGPARPGGNAPSSGDVFALPAGPLATPDSRYSVAGQSFVSVRITHSVISGNAYGLFVSSANGIAIADSRITRSLIDGIVLHRFASNGLVERTVSSQNAGNGFVVARATHEIRLTGCTAAGNGGNGFSLIGRPLADGPSPAGESVASYGNNSIANSTARGNSRYGIEVDGGQNVGIQNNQVDGSDMGIVARRGAEQVSIVGNNLTGQTRQSISIRDGVHATVTGNVVDRTGIGIYLRDSVAAIRGNTITDVTNHGITLIGAVRGAQISYNVVAGTGPTAVDTARSHGKVKVDHNQVGGWHDTRSLAMRLRQLARPMTLLWTAIVLLILVSAIRARRWRAWQPGRDPYELQRSLEVGVGWAAGRHAARDGGPAPESSPASLPTMAAG
jgi:copper-binding protein NosD/parallel beta helix pectate lyase-like protein